MKINYLCPGTQPPCKTARRATDAEVEPRAAANHSDFKLKNDLQIIYVMSCVMPYQVTVVGWGFLAIHHHFSQTGEHPGTIDRP